MGSRQPNKQTETTVQVELRIESERTLRTQFTYSMRYTCAVTNIVQFNKSHTVTLSDAKSSVSSITSVNSKKVCLPSESLDTTNLVHCVSKMRKVCGYTLHFFLFTDVLNYVIRIVHRMFRSHISVQVDDCSRYARSFSSAYVEIAKRKLIIDYLAAKSLQRLI